MKFLLEIANTKVLLTQAQLEKLSDALDGAERIEDKYVGNSKYLKLIRPYVTSESLKGTMMTLHEYGAMQLVTKLEDEKS